MLFALHYWMNFYFFNCWGCNQPQSLTSICKNCRDTIRYNDGLMNSPASGVQAIAPLIHSLGTTHTLFKAWKNQPNALLKHHLIQFKPAMIRELKSLHFSSITPIPQLYSRSWKRGHSSAYSIALEFSKKLRIPIKFYLGLDEQSCIRQSQLSAQDRNFAANYFKLLHSPKPGERVLIVDDLITTGNTLARAAETLHSQFTDEKIIFFGASLAYRPNINLN